MNSEMQIRFVTRLGRVIVVLLALSSGIIAIEGCVRLRQDSRIAKADDHDRFPAPVAKLIERAPLTIAGSSIDEVDCRFHLERLADKGVPIRGDLMVSNRSNGTISFGVFEDMFYHVRVRTSDNQLVPRPMLDVFRKVVKLQAYEERKIPFYFQVMEHLKLPNGKYLMRFDYDVRLKRPAVEGESPIRPWSDVLQFEVSE